MYKPKYFKVCELLPESVYYQLVKENKLNRGFFYFNEKLLVAIDKIREKAGKPMIVNNYKNGGMRCQSGLRTPTSMYYKAGSYHSMGCAVDLVFADGSSVEWLREYILNHQGEFEGVGGVELGVDWLHIDVRGRINGSILTFGA